MTFNKNINRIVKSHNLDNNFFKSKQTINPRIPHIYGLPKTHKINVPMRPVISSINSPPYKLSKYLANILSSLLGKISPAHIKHSDDFLNRLRKLQSVHNMTSFDVTALFTNVPRDKAIRMLREKLEDYNDILPINVDTLMDLVEACLEFNIFQYKDHWYKQIFGLAMGSPLSAVIACLYMELLEIEKILPNLPPGATWIRYVDDVFCSTDNPEDPDNILQIINNIDDTIKFTMEKEKDNILPFLDVKVIKNEIGILSFDVYRKPTNKESYLNFYSGHNDHIKFGVMIGFFLRAYRVCDAFYLDLEITRIYDSFLKLHYPRFLISAAHKKARIIFYNPKIKKKQCKTTIILPECNTSNNIKSLLNKEYQFVQKTYNTIGKYTRRVPGKPKNSEAGVYKIPCNDCDSIYIGETGKSLSIRIKQHKQAYNRADNNNAMFVHAWTKDHTINWPEAALIIKCQDPTKRKLTEAALIKENDTFNLKRNTT